MKILFRKDNGYLDDDIIETIEDAVCQYLVKGKEYPTLASQVTGPSVSFSKSEEGQETTELFTKLDTWYKDRRFVVSRALKSQKDSVQLSFLEGDEFEYFYFVSNSEMASEKVVIAYEQRCNAENYIKEAKYDMAVVHLLLQTFWANEAIFQLMMLAFYLFLLLKMDFSKGAEYRQQITCACGTGAGKTFRLKYIFLAGKIIRTARSVVMKLSEKYPYQEVYEKSLSWKYQPSCLNLLFRFKPTRKIHFRCPNL